jgi:hypothetical protein
VVERDPIAIVGAAPVGLALALGLARHGTPCRVFDRDAGPCVISRATEVHARTLEVLDLMGVAAGCFARERSVASHGSLQVSVSGLQGPMVPGSLSARLGTPSAVSDLADGCRAPVEKGRPAMHTRTRGEATAKGPSARGRVRRASCLAIVTVVTLVSVASSASGSSIGILPDPDVILIFRPQDDHLFSVVEEVVRGDILRIEKGVAPRLIVSPAGTLGPAWQAGVPIRLSLS